MREALDATRVAVERYAEACRALQAHPHPALEGAMLDLQVRRLDALAADLRRRARPQAAADALYAGLGVVHAGLASLADASGRLHRAYRATMPLAAPAEGWFSETPEGGAEAGAGRAGVAWPEGQEDPA